METNELFKEAAHGNFQPYEIRVVDTYRTSSMSWMGMGGHRVEIWGLFYDETEIARGGITSMQNMCRVANVAYNNGILECLGILGLNNI